MTTDLHAFLLEYEKNGHKIVRTSDVSSDVSVYSEITEGRVLVRIKPEVPLVFRKISVTVSFPFPEGAKVFLNGYQSWTNCREVTKDDKIVGIKPLAARLPVVKTACSWFGDYTFRTYGGKGVFHGYTYGYSRRGKETTLFGSMSEDNGFTVFTFDLNRNVIVIEREIDGFAADKEFVALDVKKYVGGSEEVFDRYFADMGVKKPRLDVLNGYTSWYHYFQKINREIILSDLRGISEVLPKPDIFQIDDGWQTAVGDWLSVDSAKFPNGMKECADAVHDKKMLAGLWLAPFLSQKKSQLVVDHPDWLLRDEKGKPRMGNIGWGGAYILDFYNDGFRAYLKKTFETVLSIWGYDLVKLDFLYAVCLYPQHGKSRGQIMAEAMEFLRSLVGSKLILGCGVPLGSAFGRVDLCRISADVDLSYRSRFYSKLSNREIVSTRCVLENTVFRRQLDGRAFGNDPDVFFLRDSRLKFTETEKHILATLNSLLGTVRFVSDSVQVYGEAQKSLLAEAFSREKAKLISTEFSDKNRLLTVVYEDGGEKRIMEIPLR